MIRHLDMGGLRVDLLPEITHRYMPVSFLFNDLTPDDMARNADWLGPDHLDAANWQIGIAFQAFVVRTGGLTILVDSCNGNHKPREAALWQHDLRSTAFMDNLAALGLRPEDIDIVLCTHLHCDHVGWNTRLEGGQWVPTFPNARHIFDRGEYDHTFARYQAEGAGLYYGSFADSVLPVVQAGLVDLVDPHHPVVQGAAGEVSLTPAPGHSFGHVCVSAKGGGEEAMIIGDALHNAVQLDMPDLVMRADLNPEQAAQSRRKVLNHCADTGAWLCAGHVPLRSISRVRRAGDVFRFQ